MSKRALVVDDDERVRRVFTAYLEVEGISSIEAADGVEGLALARVQRPDVIVADLMMPNMDGLTMTRRLHATPETADIPVLLVSGVADTPREIDDLDGRVGYISKPIGLAAFLAAVRRLVAAQAVS